MAPHLYKHRKTGYSYIPAILSLCLMRNTLLIVGNVNLAATLFFARKATVLVTDDVSAHRPPTPMSIESDRHGK